MPQPRLPDHIVIQILIRLDAEQPILKIYNDLGVARSAIYRIRDNMAIWGAPYPPERSMRSGPDPLLTQDRIQALLAFLEDCPTSYLDEMQQYLFDAFDVTIAVPTIYKYLRSVGWSRKAVRTRASERSEPLRTAFRGIQHQYDADQLVFIDESAANERTGDRKFGWSPRGVACVVSRPLKRLERWSILPALGCNGYIDWLIHQGAITGEMFLEFLTERVLPNCEAFPGKRSVIILDNATVHQNYRVREACEEKGVKLLFLPPYSPDFNPIEETFKDLKAWIKRHYLEMYEFDEFSDFLEYAVEAVCRKDARGHFRNCGYIS